MRNTLAFKLFNQMGNYASRTRFCEVTLNGHYQGIYIFGEKIKRDKGRVDIAKLTAEENAGESMSGGYIFKIDYWDSSNSWMSEFHPIDHPELDVHYVYEYPDFDVITNNQKEYLSEYVNAFETALYSNNFSDPMLGYSPYINTDAFINYFIVNELSRNNDGFKKSFFIYKDRDSVDHRLNLGPVWDFDWAWKNIDECQIFANTDGSGWAYEVNDCGPDVNSPGWHIRLLQDTGFTNRLNCQYHYYRTNILSKDSLFNYISRNSQYLFQAQQRHYERWPILGLNVGTPVVGDIPTTFQGEIDGFKDWIAKRLDWLDANIPGSCLTTGIVDPLCPEAIIFPNPAKTAAYIQLESGKEMGTIQFHDSRGAGIFIPYHQGGSDIRLEVSAIPSGVYFCKLIEKKSQLVATLKLIVIH